MEANGSCRACFHAETVMRRGRCGTEVSMTLSVIAARCQISPFRRCAHLPPAPGEDVTVGDKRGNLARERLRGRGKTLTALPERVKKVGQKRPQTFLTHK